MKAKILILLLVGTLLGSPVSAELDFEIKENCEPNEETLFSMYSKTGGNIAEPDHFKWQVCAGGLENSEIKDSCSSGENSLISMFQRNDSHASINQEYRWDICAPKLESNLSQSCDNPIVSMASESDSHIAEPGYYDQQLCPIFIEPDNVSFEMEFDASKVYVDGETAEERSYNPIELGYPYIVSDQPAGFVNYGELEELSYQTQSSKDKFRMVQSTNSPSVLVPFTNGGYLEIEDDEEDINDKTFLNRNSPSFGFPTLDTPTVKVRTKLDYTAQGFDDIRTGEVDLSIRNRENNDDKVEILISAG